ncbi:hypothetical protein PC121_g16758 [Phytophthora cactorum]|nr:hypothetical protein PC121_g16758 [Phytophthora cactorum]
MAVANAVTSTRACAHASQNTIALLTCTSSQTTTATPRRSVKALEYLEHAEVAMFQFLHKFFGSLLSSCYPV